MKQEKKLSLREARKKIAEINKQKPPPEVREKLFEELEELGLARKKQKPGSHRWT